MEGKRILVHLVVNVEHWQFENAMPRTIITPPHGRETVPDVPNFSWADYGMRAGLPRILDLFNSRGLPASASFNAGVIDAYPEAAEAMRDAGWEFIGHGMHQKALNHVEGGEAALIRACLQKIEGFTGKRCVAGSRPVCARRSRRRIFSTRLASIMSATGLSTTCRRR